MKVKSITEQQQPPLRYRFRPRRTPKSFPHRDDAAGTGNAGRGRLLRAQSFGESRATASVYVCVSCIGNVYVNGNAWGLSPKQEATLEGAQGVKMRMLIGPSDGAQVFHMRHFEIAPGGHSPHHVHDYEHEVLILKGQGLIRSEHGDYPCDPGDVVWVPPNEKHQFQNPGPQPLEFICLIPAPGKCMQ